MSVLNTSYGSPPVAQQVQDALQEVGGTFSYMKDFPRTTTIASALSRMRSQGFKFVHYSTDNTVTYTTTVAGDLSIKPQKRGRRRAAPRAKGTDKAASNGHLVHPQLGDTFKVTTVGLDPDGNTIHVIAQGDKRAWHFKVEPLP